MKKQDLKTGMLVQFRDGDVGMVINDTIAFEDEFMKIKTHNDNLIYNRDNSLDIIKVSKQLSDNLLIPKYWTEETLNKNLLWERYETFPKKEELKSGMLVKFNNGEIGLIVNSTIILLGETYESIDDYDSKLFLSKDWYIVAISNVLNDNDLKTSNWTEETINDNLFWKRN